MKTQSVESARSTAWLAALSHGLALFLGLFTLANLLWELRTPGSGGNLWWIDLRAMPDIVAQVLLVIAAGCLSARGV